MILGLNPLAMGIRPLPFKPWQSARCLGLFDASYSGNTITSSRTTVAVSLANPSVQLTVPSTYAGPTMDTSIGGRSTWLSDGSTVILRSTSFSFPAISSSNHVFAYMIMKGIASPSGSNVVWAGGATFNPSLVLGYSGGGLISFNSAGITLTSGYTQGTPKRMVQSFTGTTGTDALQWGSSIVTGSTSTSAAGSGLTLFTRGNNTEFSTCGVAIYGLFTGDPSTGGLLTLLDSYYASAYGASWAALVS